ncbi:hypothetical protein SBA2_450054 [Acidobacteriia bacterium SbA2]|nr:hypothetical protein SBA2_450054 [Acidobacteriia bacterium SbA2]
MEGNRLAETVPYIRATVGSKRNNHGLNMPAIVSLVHLSPLYVEAVQDPALLFIGSGGLGPPDKSPRHIAESQEGRGFSLAMEKPLIIGALAPEATWLQGLKAQPVTLAKTAGLKPRPSAPRYDRHFRH